VERPEKSPTRRRAEHREFPDERPPKQPGQSGMVTKPAEPPSKDGNAPNWSVSNATSKAAGSKSKINPQGAGHVPQSPGHG
jgi:hypothetical protein